MQPISLNSKRFISWWGQFKADDVLSLCLGFVYAYKRYACKNESMFDVTASRSCTRYDVCSEAEPLKVWV